MNPFFRLTSLFGIIISTGVTVLAHPGHGQPGAAHYVTESDHLLPVVLIAGVVLLAIAAAMFGRKPFGRKPIGAKQQASSTNS